MIKYPKLASIILLVPNAYIHVAQFMNINKLEKNYQDSFALLFIILKKISHLEK